jgi:large subunit ribosomal protein L19e
MNLKKKSALAAKTLGVGRDRIVLNQQRLSEIKDAITKQDIRDLFDSGAISIKLIRGRKTLTKRKNRRRAGSIKHSPRKKKKEYAILIRKLRAHLAGLKRKGAISREKYLSLRKEIKTHIFKSKHHLMEAIASEANKTK